VLKGFVFYSNLYSQTNQLQNFDTIRKVVTFAVTELVKGAPHQRDIIAQEWNILSTDVQSLLQNVATAGSQNDRQRGSSEPLSGCPAHFLPTRNGAESPLDISPIARDALKWLEGLDDGIDLSGTSTALPLACDPSVPHSAASARSLGQTNDGHNDADIATSHQSHSQQSHGQEDESQQHLAESESDMTPEDVQTSRKPMPLDRQENVLKEREYGLRTRACTSTHLSKPDTSIVARLRPAGSSVASRQDSSRKRRRLLSKTAVIPDNSSSNTAFHLRQSCSGFFQGLNPIPKDLIQPLSIYQGFAESCQDCGSDDAWLLTRTFFAIASPDAFYQVREACVSVRQNDAPPWPRLGEDLPQTLRALDRLDTAASTASILRRYYLTSLTLRREEREEHHQHQRPNRVPRILKYGFQSSTQTVKSTETSEVYGRADSKALADLMSTAYPDLKPTRTNRAKEGDEYQTRLRSLKNRLRGARTWYMIQQKFPLGILALIPTGGDYEIKNSELVSSMPTIPLAYTNSLERLPADSVSLLLDALEKHRGNFIREASELVTKHILQILLREDLSCKVMLEDRAGSSVKQEQFDSTALLDTCRLGS